MKNLFSPFVYPFQSEEMFETNSEILYFKMISFKKNAAKTVEVLCLFKTFPKRVFDLQVIEIGGIGRSVLKSTV